LRTKNNILREGGGYEAPHVEYVPTYEAPQLFRWKGYWVEIKRNGGSPMYNPVMGHQTSSVIFLTYVLFHR
jgi:chaperone BCS1